MLKNEVLLLVAALFFVGVSFCAENDLKGVCPQPIIHIYNNISTSGSSIGSAFKYFTLMVVAWESGARFVGYSDLGFINKVLKPVFNWLKKQTNFSASRFINYLRAKNLPTVNIFVDWILEPMRQSCFKATLPVEIRHVVGPQDRNVRRVNVPLRYGISEVETQLHQEPVNDQIIEMSHDHDNDNQKDIHVDEQAVVDDVVVDNPEILNKDENKDQIPNQGTIIIDKNNPHYPEKILAPFLTVSKLMPTLDRFVSIPACQTNVRHERVLMPAVVEPSSSDVLHTVNHASHNGIKNKKGIEYGFVEEFLKKQFQNGDDTKEDVIKKRGLIKSFYVPDPEKFPSFYKQSEAFREHLRVSFFLYAKLVYVNPVPLLVFGKGRGLSHLSCEVPIIYDEGLEILEKMSGLYHLFEETPQECLAMIATVWKQPQVIRGSRL